MVGANAVVTKDVAPGDVVGGVPAVSLKRPLRDLYHTSKISSFGIQVMGICVEL